MTTSQASIRMALLEIFGPDRVSNGPADLLAYSRDLWPKLLLEMRAGLLHPQPAFVVWPRSTDEISRLLGWAHVTRVPVTPWGGGSGVCGAALPVKGGIVLDTKRMDRILHLDRISCTVTAQTGVLGQHLEDDLQASGFTLGHFPSSMYCSTLGGWLATRSAGQLSTRYGKIEDLVLSVEAVLPDGRVMRTRATPRSATGPSILQLLVGSEGTLAVLSEATLAVHPAPEAHAFRAYAWTSLSPALEGIRKVMQLSIRPAVVRLYDELDTRLALGSRSSEVDGCLLVLRFEGHGDMVQVESGITHRILQCEGAKDLGPELAEHWWAHRHSVSYRQSPVLYQEGTFLDTIEVAATWDRVEGLYRAMKQAISSLALVMAHFSHLYAQGASIYFTFVGKSPGKEVQTYDDIWQKAMEICGKLGGTISHHHGIGRLKAPWMKQEHGEGLQVLQAVKRALDPHRILNPGNMGL